LINIRKNTAANEPVEKASFENSFDEAQTAFSDINGRIISARTVTKNEKKL
jgi:hypothetical protein